MGEMPAPDTVISPHCEPLADGPPGKTVRRRESNFQRQVASSPHGSDRIHARKPELRRAHAGGVDDRLVNRHIAVGQRLDQVGPGQPREGHVLNVGDSKCNSGARRGVVAHNSQRHVASRSTVATAIDRLSVDNSHHPRNSAQVSIADRRQKRESERERDEDSAVAWNRVGVGERDLCG
eukprot:51531-Rhodomonas_salina.1